MLAYTTVTNDTTPKNIFLAGNSKSRSKGMPLDTNTGASGSVRSVIRAVEILTLIGEDTPELTVKDAVAATGLPKTTVLRLLQTLDDAGLLWANEGKYKPGPELLRLARIADDLWRLPPPVTEVMMTVAERCQETVNFYIRKGMKRVCIAQAQGPQSLRHVIKVGDELPLWAGASAKILLTNTPEQICTEIAKSSPMGIAHLSVINEWIESVKDHGWAESHAERDDGVSAVAVPVTPRNSNEVMALSLSGPSSRFTEPQIPKFVEELKAAAKIIEDH